MATTGRAGVLAEGFAGAGEPVPPGVPLVPVSPLEFAAVVVDDAALDEAVAPGTPTGSVGPVTAAGGGGAPMRATSAPALVIAPKARVAVAVTTAAQRTAYRSIGRPVIAPIPSSPTWA